MVREQWVVRVSSNYTNVHDLYGVFHGFQRALNFARRINKRIARERTMDEQMIDRWYATVEPLWPVGMRYVEASGWVGRRDS